MRIFLFYNNLGLQLKEVGSCSTFRLVSKSRKSTMSSGHPFTYRVAPRCLPCADVAKVGIPQNTVEQNFLQQNFLQQFNDRKVLKGSFCQKMPWLTCASHVINYILHATWKDKMLSLNQQGYHFIFRKAGIRKGTFRF